MSIGHRTSSSWPLLNSFCEEHYFLHTGPSQLEREKPLIAILGVKMDKVLDLWNANQATVHILFFQTKIIFLIPSSFFFFARRS